MKTIELLRKAYKDEQEGVDLYDELLEDFMSFQMADRLRQKEIISILKKILKDEKTHIRLLDQIRRIL